MRFPWIKKLPILFLIFCLTKTHAIAQDVELKLDYDCGDTISKFSKVYAIDNRVNKKFLGYVQKGLANSITMVKYDGDFTKALSKFFMYDGKPSNQIEAAFILNELFLSEQTSSLTETGSLRLCMQVFVKDNLGKFHEDFYIDSTLTCYAMDVTKKTLRSISEAMCMISYKAAKKTNKSLASQTSYTLDELYHYDSVQKLHIPIYNATKIKSGVYINFEQFKNNMPDNSVISIDSSHKYWSIKKWDEKKNRFVNFNYSDYYAVSDGITTLKINNRGLYKISLLSDKNTGLGIFA